MMQHYTVVCTNSTVQLCQAVNQLVSEGWSPHGSMLSTVLEYNHNSYVEYCQAMWNPNGVGK